MHIPGVAMLWGHVFAGECSVAVGLTDHSVPRVDCDRACLEGFATSYVAALAAKDPSRAPFADDIKFTENSVEMPIGEGLWGSVTAIDPKDGMVPADTETANVAWFGHAHENG